MLYLESPKGVGFSYCEGVTDSSECTNDDTTTAQDAYEFVVNWFKEYPEYGANKFYITGESYAGIYIPMLMEQIADNSLNAKPINLVGAAIGNGCWGVEVQCPVVAWNHWPHSVRPLYCINRWAPARTAWSSRRSTPTSTTVTACTRSRCGRRSKRPVATGASSPRGIFTVGPFYRHAKKMFNLSMLCHNSCSEKLDEMYVQLGDYDV